MRSTDSASVLQSALVSSAHQQHSSAEFERLQLSNYLYRVRVAQCQIEQHQVGIGLRKIREKFASINEMTSSNAHGSEHLTNKSADLRLIIEHKGQGCFREMGSLGHITELLYFIS